MTGKQKSQANPDPTCTHQAAFWRQCLRLYSKAYKKIRYKLHYARVVGGHAARTKLARAFFSLPGLRHRDPRAKVAASRALCESVHEKAAPPTGRDWLVSVWPSETQRRQPPVASTIEELRAFTSGSLPYQQGCESLSPEVFLACFHRPAIFPRDFSITSSQGRIVFESALSKWYVLERSERLNRIGGVPTRHLSGTYCHLGHPWSSAYYHWILEVLPKLSILNQDPSTRKHPFIVPTLRHPFQLDTLRLAGISLDRIIQIPPSSGDITVDRLYFSESLGTTSNPSSRAVEWLRRTYLPTSKNPRRRKLYVSRRDAPSRRVANEDELVDFLSQEGFETICPGSMTFAEQVETFREASVVAAPHGAGLTNMIFAPPGATLVEFFGDNYINGCYWAISNLCDHRYGVVVSPSQTPDFHVPVARVAAVLKQIEDVSAGLPRDRKLDVRTFRP
ncbi:glycosyltransferase family 61 protein [Horticoccus sp. 23ND18S-11]|uniref:glycosyltransferase family 61 protein n=1 Tax=Horticoccus sp. 23ND18S-11 TaxID=3391832 RepID=UPI0039C9AE50